MSNLKISALADGGALQDTDEFIVARAGENYKLLGSAVASSQPGSSTTYSFPFSYDDANLENGLTVYTPTVGEVLVDACVIVDTPFNGTTPLLDIGTGVGVTVGMFKLGTGSSGVPLNLPCSEDAGTGILIGLAEQGNAFTLSQAGADWYGGGFGAATRVALSPFTATNPLKLWVSQDGTIGGSAVGGTTGEGRLFFTICTPTTSPG